MTRAWRLWLSGLLAGAALAVLLRLDARETSDVCVAVAVVGLGVAVVLTWWNGADDTEPR